MAERVFEAGVFVEEPEAERVFEIEDIPVFQIAWAVGQSHHVVGAT